MYIERCMTNLHKGHYGKSTLLRKSRESVSGSLVSAAFSFVVVVI